mmetsp:Transcript_28247/g.51076  ORF Transcript_28247/g.51076 Transcript_28247/m.51076 type:complete len:170 (+) Transcript_28247:163-672(+)
MKFSAPLILLLAAAVQSQDDEPCPDTHESRCYCSSADITNQNCDVTQRITGTARETRNECHTYCETECGETAGSSFGCYRKDQELTLTCDKGKASACECACEHSVAVPSQIPFADQCVAFCGRTDVCNSTQTQVGMSYSCGKENASSVSSIRMEVILVAVAGITTLAFF